MAPLVKIYLRLFPWNLGPHLLPLRSVLPALSADTPGSGTRRQRIAAQGLGFLLEDNETERVSEEGGNEKEGMIDPKNQGMRAEDAIERCEVIIRSYETITRKVLKLAAFVPKMSGVIARDFENREKERNL